MNIVLSPGRRSRLPVAPRLLPISRVAAALAIALGSATSIVHASPNAPTSGQVWPVTSCEDDGPGSLRAVIGDAMTQSGHTVDLRGLQCTRITLSTGEIDIAQADLTLIGPGAGQLTIDAGGNSRVLDHPMGYLSIIGMTLSGGSYHSAGDASGGCLRVADAYFFDITVEDCRVSSDAGKASGGAVHADHLELMRSRVSGNQANSASAMAYGGGIAVDADISAKYSTFAGNAVQPGSLDRGEGGAIFSAQSMALNKCTVDHNSAPYTSALLARSSIHLSESTVSGNLAHHGAAILSMFNGERYFAEIYNTTIAFNHSDTEGDSAVFINGSPPAGFARINSSIIANNTSGATGTASDLTIDSLLGGADNLAMTVNGQPLVAPPIFTIADDPMLGALQGNGGPTRTHALRSGSPAIGAGNNGASQAFDQRGAGYPRETGVSASVDIGASQFDSIFADAFD